MKIIAGMHRSGTSLAARLFYEAGAAMGRDDTFYRADRWNPEGYYEQPEIHAVNIPLVNGPYGRMSYLFLPSTRTILRRSRKRDMADKIRTAIELYGDMVVKDPRFCLTLPAWQDHEARIHGVLVCLRDPIAVLGSLRKRNRTTPGHAFRLWLQHNQRVLENTEDVPVWYLYYPNLLDDDAYDDEMASALRFFGLATTADERRLLRQRCVRSQMDHNPAVPTRYPPAVGTLWSELRDRHRRQFEEEA